MIDRTKEMKTWTTRHRRAQAEARLADAWPWVLILTVAGLVNQGAPGQSPASENPAAPEPNAMWRSADQAKAATTPDLPKQFSSSEALQPAGSPQNPAAPPEKTAPPEIAMPRVVPGFSPSQRRLPRLPGVPAPIGTTPQPTSEVLKEYSKYVQEFIDPTNTLDLVEGRTRLMVLKEAPKRVQIGDDKIASYNLVTPAEILLQGKSVGSTNLTIWFEAKDGGKQPILSYLIRVIPDPEEKERLERVYKALEQEIAHTFPDSRVYLHLVGDKLVVSGQARDIAEATHILQVVRANAPQGREQQAQKIPVNQINLSIPPAGLIPGTLPSQALENFLTAGGPNVVNLLQIPGEQQVMLKVTVAEINRAAARSIGLDFSVTDKAGTLVFQNTTGNLTNGTTGTGTGTGTGIAGGQGGGTGGAGSGDQFNQTANLLANLDHGLVSLSINALRNLNYARSLAEPTLVTMNGQTAAFHAGGEFPVPIVTGFTAAGLQGVSFIPFGVTLQFTPYITDRDRVRLQVAAQVSTRDVAAGNTLIGTSEVPSLNTRDFQTTVELREGQTLAVAGLIQNNLGAQTTRVPFFGDLPFLAPLAGFNQTTAGEQELVVLISPVLVHPLNHDELLPLPGSDVFEPGDLEFYLYGRLESRRQYDYRSSVRTDIDRMKAYRRCEQNYISGPSGHCDDH